MVRPRRVKGRALKQRDWHMTPKKFRRPSEPATPKKNQKETKSSIDWQLVLYIGLGFAALTLLLFWAYNNLQ